MATVMGAIGEATGVKPDDSVIAMGAIGAAKLKAGFYLTALLESASPELRHLFQTHLQDTINEQHRWADLAIKKGWYKACGTPDDLLQDAYKKAQQALQ